MNLGLTWSEARRKTGLESYDFAIIARSGAFRRIGVRFDPASLDANQARAVEILRSCEAKIKEIQNDAAQRLIALGTEFEGSRT